MVRTRTPGVFSGMVTDGVAPSSTILLPLAEEAGDGAASIALGPVQRVTQGHE